MRKILSDCHPSFSQENVKGSSNYKIIKCGRSLDLAFKLGAMTRRGYSRDCHVNNDNNSLSYVREADNKNLLAGELEISFNLTPPFLLVSSARQSLTRFGHRVCNACIASLSLAHKLTNALPAVKLLSQSNFILVPSYIRGGEKGEYSYIRGGVMGIIAMTMISLFSFNAHATCTPTPDCADMGYTETSCDGKFVRCPFDTSKLFCTPCDSKFQYTCSGDYIVSGEGNSCGNKYISCECVFGATFSNGDCICDTSCSVGNIYYSDKTSQLFYS